MSVYLLKMKRKDIEYVNGDFSLVSPATKIRRLDAELPPIIEEDEPDFPWPVGVDSLAFNVSSSSQVMVEMPPATSESVVDRSTVLFSPTPLPLSPSRFSVDSDILSGIKKNIYSSSLVKSAENEEEEGRKNRRRNECLAVIPWNPSLQQLRCTATSGNMQQSELEEHEQMGEATIMDIEEDNTGTEYYSQQWQQQQYSHMNEKLLQQQQQQQQYSQMNENLLQWQLHQQQQQQNCMMIQQPPQSASASLMQYQWW